MRFFSPSLRNHFWTQLSYPTNFITYINYLEFLECSQAPIWGVAAFVWMDVKDPAHCRVPKNAQLILAMSIIVLHHRILAS